MTKQKKKQKQEQGNIIKPDFSALIEQMQQEQARAGKKQRPKPETKREQEPEVITVTPADIEPPRKHEGSEQEQGTDTGRAERLQRARELVREEKQEQGNIIKPDFSALIEQMQQEQAQRPKPEQEQEPETITVTPDDITSPSEQAGSEHERERQERLQRAKAVLAKQDSTEQAGTTERAGATGADAETAETGEVLEPLLIHETEAHKRNADRWDGATKFEAIERVMGGETIVSVSKDMSIPRRTMEGWLAEYREVREQQSVVNDFREIDLIETATNELLRGINKAKVAEASVRDIGIAYGILRDKLKDIRGPKTGTGNLRLRATFRGEGAIEVTTSEQ
jgi:hypothetical protein